MGKARSITQQLIHAIADCSAIGESKRSYKLQNNGDSGYKIFGKEYKDDLQKTSRDLGGYIKENYPSIRRVRDITPDALQNYLQSKHNCSLSYINRQISHINKLQKCCSHTYGKSDWKTDRLRVPAQQDIPEEKIRSHVATEYEFSRLLGVMHTPRAGESWKAVILAKDAGLRVQETANIRVGRLQETGGKWGCGTITLQGAQDGCKGGRWRTVDILSPEARNRLKTCVNGLQPGDYIIRGKDMQPLQPDSINRALQRAIKRTPDLQESWDKNNGLHAFRKSFAQACYDAARNSGCSKKEAADYANKQLGHGHNRSDLTAVYIQNQW